MTTDDTESILLALLNEDEAVGVDGFDSGLRFYGPGSGQIRGVFRTFIEVVDLATMFVSDGGYNTSVLSIPYKVERP